LGAVLAGQTRPLRARESRLGVHTVRSVIFKSPRHTRLHGSDETSLYWTAMTTQQERDRRFGATSYRDHVR
jgi:hypothetical protein